MISALQNLNSRAPLIVASIVVFLDACVSVLLVGTLNVAVFLVVMFWEPHRRFLVSYVATLLIFDRLLVMTRRKLNLRITFGVIVTVVTSTILLITYLSYALFVASGDVSLPALIGAWHAIVVTPSTFDGVMVGVSYPAAFDGVTGGVSYPPGVWPITYWAGLPVVFCLSMLIRLFNDGIREAGREPSKEPRNARLSIVGDAD